MLSFPQLTGRVVRVGAWCAAVACAVATTVPFAGADGAAKPLSIKAIMKQDMKGDNSIVKHIVAGKATDTEMTKLLADVKTMSTEEPPAGEKQAWQDRMTKLVAAAEAVQGGDKSADAIAKFKAAVNCKGCHEAHKEKD